MSHVRWSNPVMAWPDAEGEDPEHDAGHAVAAERVHRVGHVAADLGAHGDVRRRQHTAGEGEHVAGQGLARHREVDAGEQHHPAEGEADPGPRAPPHLLPSPPGEERRPHRLGAHQRHRRRDGRELEARHPRGEVGAEQQPREGREPALAAVGRGGRLPMGDDDHGEEDRHGEQVPPRGDGQRRRFGLPDERRRPWTPPPRPRRGGRAPIGERARLATVRGHGWCRSRSGDQRAAREHGGDRGRAARATWVRRPPGSCTGPSTSRVRRRSWHRWRTARSPAPVATSRCASTDDADGPVGVLV